MKLCRMFNFVKSILFSSYFSYGRIRCWQAIIVIQRKSSREGYCTGKMVSSFVTSDYISPHKLPCSNTSKMLTEDIYWQFWIATCYLILLTMFLPGMIKYFLFVCFLFKESFCSLQKVPAVAFHHWAQIPRVLYMDHTINSILFYDHSSYSVHSNSSNFLW